MRIILNNLLFIFQYKSYLIIFISFLWLFSFALPYICPVNLFPFLFSFRYFVFNFKKIFQYIYYDDCYSCIIIILLIINIIYKIYFPNSTSKIKKKFDVLFNILLFILIIIIIYYIYIIINNKILKPRRTPLLQCPIGPISFATPYYTW